MTLKRFRYSKDGKITERELIVTEESDTHLAGYDISKLSDEEQKETWRAVANNFDKSKLTEEQIAEEYNKFKAGQLAFRKFLKSKVC